MDFKNRKALHNYTVKERFTAGICLPGWAVKSLRAGRVDLKDAFVRFHANGTRAMVENLKMVPLSNASPWEATGESSFQLLLTRREMHKLWTRQQEGGVAFPVLSIVLKKGRFKLEFALAVGKKEFDKKRFEKKREWERRTKE